MLEQYRQLYKDITTDKNEQQLTTTMIVVCPCDIGKPSMKSIEIFVHICSSMGRG